MDNSNIFSLSNYQYELPGELIAQQPLPARGASRLLILERKNSSFREGLFTDLIEVLNQGDVLVLNNTKVIRARIFGVKPSGAKVEVLLLKDMGRGRWHVLVKPGKRVRINDTLIFDRGGFSGKILSIPEGGGRIIEFEPRNLWPLLEKKGIMPLPPYIKQDIDDPARYQTVYAKFKGAVAAPTAGLHFTQDILKEIKKKGVSIVYVTLHCGLGTFQPVKSRDIREHKMSAEWVGVSPETARIINKAKSQEKRIFAVGTTSIRALESSSYLSRQKKAVVKPYFGETNLYILPGYSFKVADALITNFHTPLSSNLILVSTFAGYGLTMAGYKYAIGRNFRFFSFGDAMIIL